MLDLDFTPGVLITDGVSLATYAGGGKKKQDSMCEDSAFVLLEFEPSNNVS